jgi:hypothetical protein
MVRETALFGLGLQFDPTVVGALNPFKIDHPISQKLPIGVFDGPTY